MTILMSFNAIIIRYLQIFQCNSISFSTFKVSLKISDYLLILMVQINAAMNVFALGICYRNCQEFAC